MPRSINIGGLVPQRIYQGRNLDAFAKSLDKIDERAKQALAQRNQIAVALGQLNLNAAEDEWRANYVRDIQQQLDEAAVGGDYSQTLQQATILAGKVASDPAIIGRVKANAAYEEFKKTTQNRNDITEDVKQYALANNPYRYEDNYDKEGHLVGGTNWQPELTPVSTVGGDKIWSMALQLAAKETGKGVTDIQYVDANGNLTSDPKQGVYGMAYKKSGGYERLSQDKLWKAIDAAINAIPGARASLQQDYDVARWKYNKMTPEERKARIDSDITDNGLLLTPEQYFKKRFAPGVSSASYYNAWNDVEVGDGYKSYLSAAAASGANGANGAGLSTTDADVEQSVTIEEDMQSQLADNFKNLSEVINGKPSSNGTLVGGLRQLFPNLSKTNAFNRGVREGRYNELANLCLHSIKDPKLAGQARELIKQLRNLGYVREQYMRGVPKPDRQAVEFNAALESGTPLPNNDYSHKYNDTINRLFNVNNKKADNADMVGWKCVDTEEFNDIASALGCTNRTDWSSKGFTIKEMDGDKVICFKNTNRYLTKLADAVDNASGLRTGFKGIFFNHGIVRYKNGELLKDPHSSAYNDLFDKLRSNSLFGGVASEAKSITNRVNAARGVNTKAQFVGAVYSESFAKRQLMQDYNNGRMDEKQYNIKLKNLEDQENNAYFGNNLLTYNIYSTDETGIGNLAKVKEQDKRDIVAEINQAKAQNRVTVRQMLNPITGQYGAYYHIMPADNDKKANTRDIFISGVGSTMAAKYFMNDTRNQALSKINTASSLRGAIHDINGNYIANIDDYGNAVLYNARGKAVKSINKNEAIKFVATEENRQQIADAIHSGSVQDNNTLVSLITHSLADQGYSASQITAPLIKNELSIILKNY